MTRVDFYLLNSEKHRDQALFVCKLTEKIYKSGLSVFIFTGASDMGETLNKQLWTFRDVSFIPHSYQTDKSTDPVFISDQTPPQHKFNVLINLSSQVPEFCGEFDRISEIIESEEQRTAARERFRIYRQHGFEINTHEI